MNRRLRNKLTVETDLARLRLRHGRTLAPVASDGSRVALFVSLSTFVYQLKLEGMIAKALELEGLTPVFLVPPGDVLARRYLHAFGVRRFLEIPDFVDAALEREADDRAERVLAAEPSVADLMELEIAGATVGRHVLSSVSRGIHEGSLDLGRPDVRAALARVLPIAFRSALAADAILERIRPEVVVFIERNYAAEAPFSDLALKRGLNVIQFVSALQDDGLLRGACQ
jgi:hypothetical protein